MESGAKTCKAIFQIALARNEISCYKVLEQKPVKRFSKSPQREKNSRTANPLP